MLTDMYQISMSYAYWKNRKHEQYAVFDLFFRKCPFGGEFCIFAGLDEVLKYLSSFRFQADDISYLRDILPASVESEFFDYLININCENVKVFSVAEGSIVFPKQPLLRVEGPLLIAQLLETTLLNLINYPSLIATNAARMRLAAGSNVTLLEFGLRRAQGPDGALSASKYAYLGGFDGTSNVLAGKLNGIDVKGTHAHSYIMSYKELNDLEFQTIVDSSNPSKQVNFVDIVLQKREYLNYHDTHDGELAAFISYAQSYPNNFLSLVDTYDTLKSGVLNYIIVGWALYEIGYKPIGIRLDSGDLAYLSKSIRQLFIEIDQTIGQPIFASNNIVASNDLNEEVILSLNRQGHEIDTFGVGTNLVTCLSQPALGCVYKLVEIDGNARIKLSEEVEKLVIPGKKSLYRLYGRDGHPLLDLMQKATEDPPEVGQRILVRHPFKENKRAYVTAAKVENLLQVVWDGTQETLTDNFTDLNQNRERCQKQISLMRPDHIRSINATPYKTSVTESLYNYIHQLWLENIPVNELN